MRWLLFYRQALKSSLDSYTQKVIGMLVSEILKTDALQSSTSVSWHEHCQVMFLCSIWLNGSIKDVSKSKNLILSQTFCYAYCHVDVTTDREFCLLPSGLHPWNKYISYIFFIHHESGCIWTDSDTFWLSNAIIFFVDWLYSWRHDVILSGLQTLHEYIFNSTDSTAVLQFFLFWPCTKQTITLLICLTASWKFTFKWFLINSDFSTLYFLI